MEKFLNSGITGLKRTIGGIYDFLRKKKIENLKDIERKEKIRNDPAQVSVSSNKLRYLEKKEYEKASEEN